MSTMIIYLDISYENHSNEIKLVGKGFSVYVFDTLRNAFNHNLVISGEPVRNL